MEISIAMAVVLIAIGGALSSISVTSTLAEASKESNRAYAAAAGVVELMRGEQFGDVFVLYNSVGADDPDGVDTAPGDAFDVLGLEPLPNDPDGRVGSILFPCFDANPGALREDHTLLGRALDLDVDGAIDQDDKSGSYVLLPVEVRVEWQSASGPRSVEIQSVLLQP